MNDSLDSMMRLANRSGCVLELVFVGGFYFGPRFRRPPTPPPNLAAPRHARTRDEDHALELAL